MPTDLKTIDPATLSNEDAISVASEPFTATRTTVTEMTIDPAAAAFSFYTSDGAADPPNALRCAVHTPHGSADLLVADATKDDLRPALARLFVAAAKKLTE